MEADLYTIHEEMLTLVELHRIQKNCSMKNNITERLGNLNFIILKHKIINFKSWVQAPPKFQCVHETIQYRNKFYKKASGKPSNSLAKKKAMINI